MRQSRRIRIVDIFALLALIAILAAMFFPAFNGTGEQHRRTKCTSNLKQISTAVAQYVNAYGGDSVLPVPAASFRGDTWLCVLYWKGLLSDERTLICPSTADSADALQEPDSSGWRYHGSSGYLDTSGWGYPITSAEFGKAGTVGSNQVSYCGRTNMSSGTHATVTPTEQFTVKAFKGSPIACDKAGNHDDVIHAVFADGHVEPFPDTMRFVGDKTQTGGTDAMRTFQYMDNGDP